MNADFAFKVTVGILAFNGKGGAFNAGLITGLQIDYFGGIAALLGPAQIHAKHHLGPVLGIGAPCAGIDGYDGIVAVSLPVQHHVDGKSVNAFVEGLDLGLDLGQGQLVVFLQGHGQQQFVVFQLLQQTLIGIDAAGQEGAFLEYGRGIFRVIPEIFAGDDGFQLTEPDLFGGQVKDSLRAG